MKEADMIALLAQRWKAVAALAGSLATAMLVVLPGNTALQLVIAIVGALLTGGIVHQVTNALPAGTVQLPLKVTVAGGGAGGGAGRPGAPGTATVVATSTAETAEVAEKALDAATDVIAKATGRRRKT